MFRDFIKFNLKSGKISKLIKKIFLSLIISFFTFKLIFDIILTEKSNQSKNVVKSNVNHKLFVIDKNKTIKILWWNKFYTANFIGKHIRKCPKTNCIFSDNRSDLSSYDAVVYHWYDINPNDIPKQVYDHQKWVLFTFEPPTNTYIGLNYTGLKKVDWVMSYRSDSDVYIPYGSVTKCNKKWKQKYSFENKTKSIAWFVSHCSTDSNREKYVQTLSKYIDVDIYGKCGPHKCARFKQDCNEMLQNDYKFYLSFENSLCKEYVTEKLFQYIGYDIIPVVMGGLDYSQILPSHSYIDVFNFSSPQHLADYLKIVGSNQTLYNSYFNWKSEYCIKRVGFGDYRDYCKICSLIEENKSSFTTIDSFRKWWISGSNCRTIQFDNQTFKLVDSKNFEPGLPKEYIKKVIV